MIKSHKKGNSGVNNKNSKLTPEIILEIRSLHKDGYTLQQLSELYDISFGHISRIVRKEAWKHI